MKTPFKVLGERGQCDTQCQNAGVSLQKYDITRHGKLLQMTPHVQVSVTSFAARLPRTEEVEQPDLHHAPALSLLAGQTQTETAQQGKACGSLREDRSPDWSACARLKQSLHADHPCSRLRTKRHTTCSFTPLTTPFALCHQSNFPSSSSKPTRERARSVRTPGRRRMRWAGELQGHGFQQKNKSPALHTTNCVGGSVVSHEFCNPEHDHLARNLINQSASNFPADSSNWPSAKQP